MEALGDGGIEYTVRSSSSLSADHAQRFGVVRHADSEVEKFGVAEEENQAKPWNL